MTKENTDKNQITVQTQTEQMTCNGLSKCQHILCKDFLAEIKLTKSQAGAQLVYANVVCTCFVYICILSNQ